MIWPRDVAEGIVRSGHIGSILEVKVTGFQIEEELQKTPGCLG